MATQNQTTFQSTVDSLVADNNTGDISENDVRTLYKNLSDSVFHVNKSGTTLGSNPTSWDVGNFDYKSDTCVADEDFNVAISNTTSNSTYELRVRQTAVGSVEFRINNASTPTVIYANGGTFLELPGGDQRHIVSIRRFSSISYVYREFGDFLPELATVSEAQSGDTNKVLSASVAKLVYAQADSDAFDTSNTYAWTPTNKHSALYTMRITLVGQADKILNITNPSTPIQGQVLRGSIVLDKDITEDATITINSPAGTNIYTADNRDGAETQVFTFSGTTNSKWVIDYLYIQVGEVGGGYYFTVRGAGGNGLGDLLSTNNLSDLASASTARTNLDVYSTTEVDDLQTIALAAANRDATEFVEGNVRVGDLGDLENDTDLSPTGAPNIVYLSVLRAFIESQIQPDLGNETPYADEDAMIADQGSQTAGLIYKVSASDGGFNYYEYIGTTDGDIGDYSDVTATITDIENLVRKSDNSDYENLSDTSELYGLGAFNRVGGLFRLLGIEWDDDLRELRFDGSSASIEAGTNISSGNYFLKIIQGALNGFSVQDDNGQFVRYGVDDLDGQRKITTLVPSKHIIGQSIFEDKPFAEQLNSGETKVLETISLPTDSSVHIFVEGINLYGADDNIVSGYASFSFKNVGGTVTQITSTSNELEYNHQYSTIKATDGFVTNLDTRIDCTISGTDVLVEVHEEDSQLLFANGEIKYNISRKPVSA